jgi:rare lipoprotein A (peptidoglycan hydrolase)
MSNPQSKAAKATANTAGTTSANLTGTAEGQNATLTPTLERQATNPTGYAPTDLNAMKVGAAETAGAATGAADEAAKLRAARSGNTASLSASEDENARNRARVLADTNLKVTGANAGVKQEQQQNALRQLASLYGTNVSGANAATGEQINAEKMIETQPAWLTGLQSGLGMAEQGALTGAKIATGA